MITLGDRVKDKISGFTGVVTGIANYITGCIQYRVEADKLDKDGACLKIQWFDEVQVEFIKARVLKMTPIEKRPAGPQNNPPMRGEEL